MYQLGKIIIVFFATLKNFFPLVGNALTKMRFRHITVSIGRMNAFVLGTNSEAVILFFLLLLEGSDHTKAILLFVF